MDRTRVFDLGYGTGFGQLVSALRVLRKWLQPVEKGGAGCQGAV
jgi:hypothetical protein